VYLSPTL
jgi:hypothetical protein